MGIIKRIGYGAFVNIWDDNLLPFSQPMRPLIHKSELNLAYVSELMHPNEHSWNELIQ